ncbi:hypothetical protein [Dolichospermum sp. UHCC 0352]|uniref:hypothetical protein n=1 Tax=Dolichospermum sp. UHCC 0352 TaxID=2590011 RepID=UPI00029B64A5|nr:hypothetical protein [Dolichospermum sp. UHCC 0352]AFW95187.1 hypothetical protein ANA_C12464 [Anabaena sp. 90]MBO1050594.1 hypothetical protein [Dolichospermum sp. DET73]
MANYQQPLFTPDFFLGADPAPLPSSFFFLLSPFFFLTPDSVTPDSVTPDSVTPDSVNSAMMFQ